MMQEPSPATESSCGHAPGQVFRNICLWLWRDSRDPQGGPATEAREIVTHGPAAIARTEEAIGRIERQFPIRIKLGIPAAGLGHRLDQIRAWLNQNCGADGWTMAGIGGSGNHSLALYLLDAAVAAAFVARWCTTGRIDAVEGVLHIREDALTVRLVATRPKLAKASNQYLAPAA